MSENQSSPLAHNVYFTLKEDSPDARAHLISECKKYLNDHPGIDFFAVGALVDDLSRPVNVRDFQIGLHIVFDSRQAHDDYQVSEKHVQFIESNKESWQQVRVFDTNLC